MSRARSTLPDLDAASDGTPEGEGRDPVSAAVRWILPYAVLTGVLLLMVRLAAKPLDNTDTYFHLRFGHEFLTGSWELGRPGSVTGFATADWVPTQWLTQVVMARFEDWFGLPGVAWLSGLQFLMLAVTFFVVARRRADPVIAVPLVMVALCASAAGMSMRPQVLSYVLVAVTTSLWLRAQETGRPPWVLVPLTWVWAMCHGMWPVGIVIGVTVVVGACLDQRSTRSLRQLAVPALSAAAACATPVGPRLVEAVLTVSSRGEYFSEWGTPVFTELNTIAALGLLGAATVIAIRRGSTWVHILLIGLAAAWTVYSLRTVPVAAAMLAPVLAASAQRLVGPRSPTLRAERYWVAGAVVAALALLAAQVPDAADRPPAALRSLDQPLSELPSGTRLLTDTGYGGYVVWRFPELEVFSHGYGDTYTTAELDRDATVSELRSGWLEIIRDDELGYAVLDPDSELAYALRELAGWRVVEESSSVQLLASSPPA